MTDRNLAIRLSLKDGDTVRRALVALGDDGQKALSRIEAASAPASRGLLALNTVTSSAKGEIQGYASRLGVAGEAMAALGPAGVVAGAAIAAIGLGLTKGIREMEAADTSMRRLESVLKATGYASGLTSKQIADMADGIEKSTMTTAESVVDATAVLATFRSVSGDSFRRATVLALDMATVFGGDMRSAAMQLGKALEDPTEGLTALRRVGVSFSQAQKDMIAAMVETGDVAGAQKVILDALEQQVGGAAQGEDGGVTGAAKHAAEAWDDMLEEFSRTSGVGTVVANALNGITSALRGLGKAEDVSAKLAEREADLAEYQTKLAELEGSGRGWSLAANFARARIKDIEKEVAALRKLDAAQREAEASEQQKADEGRANAERTRNAEAMAARLKALEAERVKAAGEAADKVAAIEAQLSKDIATAQAKANLSGVDQADVDREVSLLREVAQRKIDAVQKPLLEAQQRAAQQTAKVMADMQRELSGAADPRAAFVDSKVASLPKTATDTERQNAAAMAGALYDQKQAVAELTEELQAEEKAREKGRQVTLQYGTAEDALALRAKELIDLRAQGVISEETYAKAMEDAERRKLDAATDTASGIQRGLKSYVKQSEDSAKASEQVTVSAFTSMEDAAAKFATIGKVTFGDFANSVIADLARIATRAVTSPIASYLTSTSFASTIGSFFHGGGVVGESGGMTRAVDPRVFIGAQRRHSGGLASNEVPIIALERERILTEAQQDNTAATISGLAALANQPKGGNGEVNVNVYNSASGTQARARTSTGGNGELNIDVFIETIEDKMSRNIAKGQGLAPTLEHAYGVKRVGA